MDAVVKTLVEARGAVDTRDQKAVQSHLVAETIAMLAAAKLYLALWRDDRLAAGLEHLADAVSDLQYGAFRNVIRRRST